MTRRFALIGVSLGMVLLLAVLVVGVFGCGSGSATTTAAPQTTTAPLASTTLAPTTTASAVTTTSAAPTSSTATSVATGPTMEQYRIEFLAFAQTLQNLSTADDPSNFTEVSKVTAAQLEGAKTFVASIHSAFDQLKALQPPAEIAAAHQKVVADFEALVAATDKLLTAIENKNQAAFDAAMNEGNGLEQTLETDIGTLGSLLAGTTSSS